MSFINDGGTSIGWSTTGGSSPEYTYPNSSSSGSWRLLAAVQVPTSTVRARLSSTSLGSGFHRSTGWGSTRPATTGRRAEDLAGHDGAGAPARAYLFHNVGRPRRLRRRG